MDLHKIIAYVRVYQIIFLTIIEVKSDVLFLIIGVLVSVSNIHSGFRDLFSMSNFVFLTKDSDFNRR